MVRSEEITVFHTRTRRLIHSFLADFEGDVKDDILDYLSTRARSYAESHQDLLPLFVYLSFDGDDEAQAVLLTAVWTLYLAAAHFFDKFQDEQDFLAVNSGIAALGAGNIALAAIDKDVDTIQDMLDALGRVSIISANAQTVEMKQGEQWSKQTYLTNLAGKSASIIATGIWLGGRLAEVDQETLTELRQFGIALGLHLQLSDDLTDIAEDISQGVFTLPILEGLASTNHSQRRKLKKLLHASPLNYQKIHSLLEQMGAIEQTQHLIRAYQLQVAHFFERHPNLEAYFVDYVAIKH